MGRYIKELKEEILTELKEEILTELRKEIDNKFQEIKKINDERYELHLSDDDLMDIAGHG